MSLPTRVVNFEDIDPSTLRQVGADGFYRLRRGNALYCVTPEMVIDLLTIVAEDAAVKKRPDILLRVVKGSCISDGEVIKTGDQIRVIGGEFLYYEN